MPPPVRGSWLGLLPLLLLAAALHAQQGADSLRPAGSVTGVVSDRLLFDGPVPDAEVWLEGHGDTVRTGSDGRFVLTGVREGAYTLRVTHPRFEEFSIVRPGVAVRVLAGKRSDVELGSVSADEFIGHVCGPASQAGAVIVALRGEMLEERAIIAQLSWASLSIGRGGARVVRQGADATRRGPRHFLSCKVPAGEELQLELRESRTTIGRSVVEASPSRLTAISMVAGGLATRGRLRVSVRAEGGDAIDASVTLLNDSSTVVRESAGRVVVAALSGSRILQVAAIGYLPVRRQVMIPPDGDTTESIVLSPEPVQLAELSVTTAPQESARLAGFELRRRTAGGQYVTAEEIERKRITVLSDVFRSLQGVQVQQVGLVGVTRPGVSEDTGTPLAGNGAVLKSLRGGKLNRLGVPIDCYLTLYVDGQRRYDLWSLDQISPQDVAGIEVHGAATAPVDLIGLQGEDECGVVMVWTRSGKKQ